MPYPCTTKPLFSRFVASLSFFFVLHLSYLLCTSRRMPRTPRQRSCSARLLAANFFGACPCDCPSVQSKRECGRHCERGRPRRCFCLYLLMDVMTLHPLMIFITWHPHRSNICFFTFVVQVSAEKHVGCTSSGFGV